MIPNNTIIENSYRILGLVGEGSIGAVYKAQQFNPDRMVALKVMHDNVALDPENQKRFHREVKSLALLRHPNIVTIYRYGITAEGLPFYATEFLPGNSLSKILKKEHLLPSQRALVIAYQILRGIAFAHHVGIYHRNLKPSNIIIANEPEPDIVKILDFGCAKFRRPEIRFASARDNLTMTGMVLGSPQYMSPEQALGLPLDHRSDLYTCGQILYEMVTGSKPRFALEIAYDQRIKTPFAAETKDAYPPELAPILERALARESENRYQSAEEFMQDIALISPECIAKYDSFFYSTRKEELHARNIMVPHRNNYDSEISLPSHELHARDHKMIATALIATTHIASGCLLAALFPHLQLACWTGGCFLAFAICFALRRNTALFLVAITGELVLVLFIYFLFCLRANFL